MTQAGSCYVCPILHRKIDSVTAALSASEERERVLREALEKARMYAIHGCGTKQKDVRGKQFGSIVDIAVAALATPAQPQTGGK